MEYYSVIKKNEVMPFAVTWMDTESVILSEVSQTEKEKYHKGTCLQNRNRLTDFKNKFMVARGQDGGKG